MVIPLRFGRRRPTHWLLVGAIAAGALSVAPALAEPEFEIGLNFTGLTMADFLRAPPDTMGAVGDQHIVEVLNGILAVYQKSDGVRVMRRRTARFWRELGFPPDSLHGDPRILYDAPSQRWILVALDRFRAPNRFLLAVSQTPDPRQGWTAFAIDSDLTGQRWADFPILGIDGEAVHLWANMVDAVSDFVVGGMLIVLPQAELVSATPTVSGATTFDFPSEYGWAPVIDLDGSRMPAQMLNIEGGFPLFVQEIAGDATSPALGDRWRFSTNLYPHPPNADQPGPLRDLETSGWFSSAPVQRNGMLWVVHEMRSEHGRSAIRFLKVDPASRAVLQETIIADEQLDLFYASIAVNEFEQVVIGFSGSGESQYASAYAVVGETVEGVTEFSDPILLKEGVAGYEFIFSGRNRWGDYSATVVDPAASHVFWTFQEFVQGENSWGTQVTEIRLPLRLVEVEIDVKPGNEQNPLNPNGQGVVPVLMLGSEAFDVADVDVTTLAFGPSGGTLAHPKGPHVLDRTHDGNTDMLAHFRVNEAGVASGDGEQCVTGELLDGTPFRGCDTVRTVPPE